MPSILARFASHPGPFNRACCWAQYGFWATHCEWVMDDGQRLGSWFHEGGVRIRPANYDDGQFSRELLIALPCTEGQKAAFSAFMLSQVGKPYDWRAIVSFALSDFDWQEDDSWDCAEVFAAGLAAAGLFPKSLAVRFSRMTVRDVLLLVGMLRGI